MKLTLAPALRVGSSPCVAFIGAGGKTTAMFQLARQLPSPVIVTGTSHLGLWQGKWADQHIITETPARLEELERGLKGVILVTGETDGDRVKPINSELLIWLKEFCGDHSIPLLIEADGSRMKPLKAWAEHEPPIPSFVETVVQVVGLTGLGKTLSHENVHRPEIFAKLSGLHVGELITPDSLVRVLTHPEGGLKNIPTYAQRAILLNQADTPELQSATLGLAKALLPTYPSVIVSSLEQKKIFAVHEPVAGIILAAGESRRFGQPKQLLDWKGQPFVRAVAKTALEAGLSPVIVVTGANAEQVELAVKDLDVTVIRNEEWKSGQASSIRAGVRALTPKPTPITGEGNAGAAIFLLADQPQVNTSILRALVEKHAKGLYPIIAPMVMDRRANPVLFDQVTFPDLLLLEGDVGGRAVFHRHRVEYLTWHDDRLLLDVDTPEMYQRLISDETL
ncbi:MAG TPA: selenium cofactor biosynthesis protein YqeC [Anaerolineales bacterium]|nr:selenium cofactor biosynthesis protein YqeC [Anaerolineales bacterium]